MFPSVETPLHPSNAFYSLVPKTVLVHILIPTTTLCHSNSQSSGNCNIITLLLLPLLLLLLSAVVVVVICPLTRTEGNGNLQGMDSSVAVC